MEEAFKQIIVSFILGYIFAQASKGEEGNGNTRKSQKN